ncbi:LacI family DNA-binding transcriptional regulator [Kiritimatiellaeota bacterium B1221]|nr:LacI family DNA-binding transcriptional regulator [Kiritimatiellaeota bacterium B1221]
MSENLRITMKDIAREAGVSVSTVSLALRNDPRLKAVTCEEIQKLADALGYQRDPALSALVAYRGRTQPTGNYGVLAVLHDWDRREECLPPALFETIQGIREQAKMEGFQVELIRLPTDAAGLRTLNRNLFYRGVRGILLVSVRQSHLVMDWKNFACVSIGEYFNRPNLHRVSQNHEEVLEKVYRRLWDLGYRRIGYCNLRVSEERKHYRFAGTYYKCTQLNDEDQHHVSPFFFDEEDWSPLAWLERERPDAVMCSIPHEFLKRLAGSRFRVPENLGLAGFSMAHAGDPYTEKFAGSVMNHRQMGTAAVRLLQNLLHHGFRGVPSELEQYDIRVGSAWRDGFGVMEGDR